MLLGVAPAMQQEVGKPMPRRGVPPHRDRPNRPAFTKGGDFEVLVGPGTWRIIPGIVSG